MPGPTLLSTLNSFLPFCLCQPWSFIIADESVFPWLVRNLCDMILSLLSTLGLFSHCTSLPIVAMMSDLLSTLSCINIISQDIGSYLTFCCWHPSSDLIVAQKEMGNAASFLPGEGRRPCSPSSRCCLPKRAPSLLPDRGERWFILWILPPALVEWPLLLAAVMVLPFHFPPMTSFPREGE